jgi:SAM-dependent methyltransferase
MPRIPDVVSRKWDFNEVDWNEYESHRPPYTKELYELVFQHHELHGGRWDAALDVGAGGGTVTRVLLEKFHHVIFSDPSEGYISRANARFRKEVDAGSVSFLQRRFDEFKPGEDLPAGEPVDMITAGTCIHFGEPAQVMAQLGPLLRSGGTVTAFSYGSVPIVPSNDPAGPIIKKCKEKIMRWIHENVAPVDKSEGTGTGQSRYNNVAFDPDMWEHVRRITSLPHEPVWPEWIEPAVSRVREDESSETVDDDFITKEVDYDFFPKYFHNFAPPLPILEQIQEELEELRVAMADRKIVARWPVMIALATKR